MAGAPAARDQGARRALSRSGRARRLREALSLSALRRHAAARRPGARAGDEPFGAADGRAVRRARRADPRNPAGGIAAAHGAPGRAQDHGVHHPFDRRGDPARRPHRGDERAARPHQGGARRAVRPSARRQCAARRSALRRDARAHLERAAHRAAAAAERRGRSHEHRAASPPTTPARARATIRRAPSASRSCAAAARRCRISASAWSRSRSSWRSGRSSAIERRSGAVHHAERRSRWRRSA